MKLSKAEREYCAASGGDFTPANAALEDAVEVVVSQAHVMGATEDGVRAAIKRALAEGYPVPRAEMIDDLLANASRDDWANEEDDPVLHERVCGACVSYTALSDYLCGLYRDAANNLKPRPDLAE